MSSISSIQSSDLEDLSAAQSFTNQAYWNNYQYDSQQDDLSLDAVNKIINEVSNSQGSSPDFNF